MRRFLCCFLVIGLAVGIVVGQEETETPAADGIEKFEESVKKATAYLLSQQKEDGSIYDQHYQTTLTALSIIALCASGHVPSDQTKEAEAARKALADQLTDGGSAIDRELALRQVAEAELAKARAQTLEEQKLVGATAWQTASPTMGVAAGAWLVWPHELYRLAICRFLSVPSAAIMAAVGRDCVFCEQQMDVYGEHFFHCMKGKAVTERTTRHDAVLRDAADCLKAAGLRPRLEVVGVMGNEMGKYVRPDIVTAGFGVGWRDEVMDVVLTAGDGERESTAGKKLVDAENRKHVKYSAAAVARGMRFRALGASLTSGALGNGMASMIDRAAQHAGDVREVEARAFAQAWRASMAGGCAMATAQSMRYMAGKARDGRKREVVRSVRRTWRQ